MPTPLEQAIQFFHLRQWSAAEKLLLMIYRDSPEESQPLHYLGLVKFQLGDLDAAENYLNQACELTPNYPEQRNNLALIRFHAGKYQAAQQTYLEVLAMKPDFVEAHFNLGNTYQKQGLFKLAIACFKQAIQLDASFLRAYQNLGVIYQQLGQIPQAIRYFKKALVNQFPNHTDRIKLIFLYQYDADKSAQQLFELYRDWGSQCEYLTMPMVAGYKQRDYAKDGSRCHIAYLSPDFRDHSAVYFYQNLLQYYNKERFKVSCYSLVALSDHMTETYRRMVEHWYDCAEWSDEKISQQIVRDRVDILIDPGVGHTNNHRLGVFIRKPAPIQMTFYPTSTGLSRMDYRITDRYIEPSTKESSLSTEQLLYHPRHLFCFQAPQNSPEIGELPALKNGFITFGSFNHLAKHNTKLLSIWVQILKAVPNSRLLMKNIAFQSEAVQGYWYKLLRSFGIEEQRLIFLGPTQTRSEHLETYNQVDIALDTFPYNGMTTSLESIWMGVPVLSLLGVRHFSRVSFSFLAALELEECLAETPQEYRELAQRFAHNLEHLQDLRKCLRTRLLNSSLCEGKEYVEAVEKLYLQAMK